MQSLAEYISVHHVVLGHLVREARELQAVLSKGSPELRRLHSYSLFTWFKLFGLMEARGILCQRETPVPAEMIKFLGFTPPNVRDLE